MKKLLLASLILLNAKALGYVNPAPAPNMYNQNDTITPQQSIEKQQQHDQQSQQIMMQQAADQQAMLEYQKKQREKKEKQEADKLQNLLQQKASECKNSLGQNRPFAESSRCNEMMNSNGNLQQLSKDTTDWLKNQIKAKEAEDNDNNE